MSCVDRKRNWTRRRVMREMSKRGVSPRDIETATGRSRSTVSEVLGGKKKSTAVAEAIAGALGMQPSDIWPRIYAAPASTSGQVANPVAAAPAELAS